MRTKAEEKGVAKGVDMFASADEIHEAIVEVRDDPSYAANARRLSALYRAHPRHPMDDAVWLVEYVGDTGGAPHLLHASRRLNFMQYYSLDVLVRTKQIHSVWGIWDDIKIVGLTCGVYVCVYVPAC